VAKKIPLCTASLEKPLRQATRLDHLVVPKDIKFEMYLEVPDELHKLIEDDAVLADKIFKGVTKDYQWAVAELATVANDIDGAMSKSLKPQGWADQEWQKRAPGILDEAEARMLAHSRDAIQKWQKVRKDRKAYVVKSATKVAVGTLSVATATLGTVLAAGATGATYGAGLASLIAAIYINVKAIAQLAKLINRLRRDVDAAESVLLGELIDLVESYEKNSKGQVAAKELALAALDQFLAVSANSISKAETSMFDFKGKLDGVDIKVSEMGIKLNKVITQQAELSRSIETKLAKQLAQAGYRSKKLPKLQASVDKLGQQIQALIDDIPKALQKVKDARARYRDSYKPTLAALKAKKPGWVDNAQLALKLGDLALGAGFTTFSAADSVLVLVDSIGVEATDVLAEKML
jgi:hypothetical protein